MANEQDRIELSKLLADGYPFALAHKDGSLYYPPTGLLSPFPYGSTQSVSCISTGDYVAAQNVRNRLPDCPAAREADLSMAGPLYR